VASMLMFALPNRRLMKPSGAETFADQAMQLGRVRDHRLRYQHARWTHTITAFNFLHHVLGNNFQQALFAFA